MVSDAAEWERHSARRLAVATMLERARSEEHGRGKPSRVLDAGSYVLECRRSRFFDEGAGFKRREVTITIRLSGRLIGVGYLKEWSLPLFAERQEFFNVADDISLEDVHFAELLGSNWSPEKWPPEFGSVVLFSRLGIDSAADHEHTALACLGKFLEAEFRRRASALILKAFPLEFESELGADDHHRRRIFEIRLLAMKRLYGSALAMKPLPDQTAFPGWMWRPFRYCPEPWKRAKMGWLR